MKVKPLFCFIYFLVIACVYHNSSLAALNVDVTQGNMEKIRISIVPFRFSTKLEREIARSCLRVLSNDLSNTGLFDIDGNLPEELEISQDGALSLDKLPSLNRDILVTGSINEAPNGRAKIRIFIWDVAAGKLLSGKYFNFPVDNWRHAAHTLSDTVYSRITGEDGYFNTKIAYTAEIDSSGLRRIAIMDQDGANSTYITGEGSLASTPRFSPDSNSIVYVDHTTSHVKIMLHDLVQGTCTEFEEIDGIVSAPRFSPDGKSLLFSKSKDGATNIYSLDLQNKNVTQLTREECINTSASYSPDKKHIVFSSNKDGKRHIYLMNADGTNQRKITSGSGEYTTPVWSPIGGLIAFTKTMGNGIYVGIMRPDGSNEKLLAKGYTVDSPSWSPNGRVILFTQQDGPSGENPLKSKLVTVDITGTNKRVLSTPTNASSGHWSCVLQE